MKRVLFQVGGGATLALVLGVAMFQARGAAAESPPQDTGEAGDNAGGFGGEELSLPGAASAAGTGISTAVSRVVGGASSAVSAVVGGASSAVSGVVGGASSAVSGVVGGASSAVSGVVGGASSAGSGAPGGSSSAAPDGGTLKYSTGQVAGLIMAANEGEIAEATLARTKANNARVKAYAGRMFTDHKAALKQATELFSKLNLRPLESQESVAMRADSARTVAELALRFGKDFDKAYIDKAIEEHTKLRDLITADLLPSSASEPELETEVKALLGTVEAHLSEAESIKGAL